MHQWPQWLQYGNVGGVSRGDNRMEGGGLNVLVHTKRALANSYESNNDYIVTQRTWGRRVAWWGLLILFIKYYAEIGITLINSPIMVHMFYRLSALARFFCIQSFWIFDYNLATGPPQPRSKQNQTTRTSKNLKNNNKIYFWCWVPRYGEFQSYARYARKKDHTATPTQRWPILPYNMYLI